MTNKPKVFGIIDKHRASGILLIMHGHDSLKDGDKLIRLTDHESARAADKARIAELTEVLKNAREMVADWGAYASEYFREKHSLAGDLARIDAALSQPKEPEKC